MCRWTAASRHRHLPSPTDSHDVKSAAPCRLQKPDRYFFPPHLSTSLSLSLSLWWCEGQLKVEDRSWPQRKVIRHLQQSSSEQMTDRWPSLYWLQCCGDARSLSPASSASSLSIFAPYPLSGNHPLNLISLCADFSSLCPPVQDFGGFSFTRYRTDQR